MFWNYCEFFHSIFSLFYFSNQIFLPAFCFPWFILLRFFILAHHQRSVHDCLENLAWQRWRHIYWKSHPSIVKSKVIYFVLWTLNSEHYNREEKILYVFDCLKRIHESLFFISSSRQFLWIATIIFCFDQILDLISRYSAEKIPQTLELLDGLRWIKYTLKTFFGLPSWWTQNCVKSLGPEF